MKSFETEKNSQLIYSLMGLGMAGGVLHIGAHPDDEDIGLLAYLSCKFGVKTVYWSATRGEGGQNRIGPYRDEALGVYRTWESLAARAADRSECLFGPFYDFGYSKNAEEAMVKWGREGIVREIVRAIRLVQPHIIVSRWTGTSTDFHGQHQAVGKLAIEAFEKAGDPDQFSELKAQGLAPWQPLKFYHSMDNSGGDLTRGGSGNFSGRINPNLEREGVLRINTGEFDPISGRTYQERAWLAYNRHQTQAMGLAPTPGDFFYYYSLQRSLLQVPDRETSLFDGIDPTLTGLADHPGKGSPLLRTHLQEIKNNVPQALQQFRVRDPAKASSFLSEALLQLRELYASLAEKDLEKEIQEALQFYLARKIIDFNEVIARCLGFELEGLSERPRIIPGQQFRISARLWNHREIDIEQLDFTPCLSETWEVRSLETPGSSSITFIQDFEIITPETADLTSPYWLAKPRESYAYHWPEGEPCSRSFGSSPVAIQCDMKIGGDCITLRKDVVYREGFPGGFRELPLAVIPPISVHPKTDKEFLQLQQGEQEIELYVVARNNSNQGVAGSLDLVVPPGWKVTPGSIDLSLAEAGATKNIKHTVTTPIGVVAGRYSLQYKIRYGKRDYAVVVNPVRMGAPGLPGMVDGSNCIKEEFIITPSRVTVHIIDVKVAQGLHYAYVQGAKEEIVDALRPFGIKFYLLTDAEIGHLDLSGFDAVIIGPNAYLIREELRKHASRFLEYVMGGGVLIVQYQGYLYQDQGLTPYPFRYNQPHDRVTHEDAPVEVLDPSHILFRLPNVIRSDDFDGWIRDRGLYFFSEWDKRYRTLLSCSDPGEEPFEGGLVECQYGRGTFLYTGYSFFRQLPAGVPGAFRLFLNILALPEARILERIEFLRKLSLFSFMTDQQLDSVARIMSERWVEEGAYICRQGELGDELYIVYHGKVEVIRESGGQDQVIFLAKDGDCLGEMAVLGDIPRTASLRAQGSSQLLVIEGRHFVSLLRQNPDMAIQMIKLLVNRIAPSKV